MGSFYGTGVIVGGDSGGTGDYNKLTNTPITNLHGISPLDLSILKAGVYNVTGNYSYIAGSETKTFMEATLVQVFQDEITKNKIIRYDTYEKEKRFTISIIYDNQNNYRVERYSYENTIINNDIYENLPPQGDLSKLYTTPDGIYVWTGDGYQKLNSLGDPTWGEF